MDKDSDTTRNKKVRVFSFSWLGQAMVVWWEIASLHVYEAEKTSPENDEKANIFGMIAACDTREG